MEAQKKLLDLENKMIDEKNAQAAQENKVRDLSLKSQAEKQSLFADSKSLEAKARELEALRSNNIATETHMREMTATVADLEAKRRLEDKAIAENESRIAWEKASIQDGEQLLKSQIKAAAEAEKAKEQQDDAKNQALFTQQSAEKKIAAAEEKLKIQAARDIVIREKEAANLRSIAQKLAENKRNMEKEYKEKSE